MKHTLVAAFANLTDVNRTRGDLMSRGIARERIHSVGADSAEIHSYDAPYSTTEGSLDRDHHESKVAHFFKSLFGHEPHEHHRRHATAYPDAVRRGALVIAVDADDEDQLAKARDALEYNGAISIDDRGTGTGTGRAGYPGPSSPYAGATGGDSHLDKHFTSTAAAGSASSVPPADGHGVGSSAKRAGTDYPNTAATANPTGGGVAGPGTGATEMPQGVGSREAGTCTDRVCVIQRPS
ncbi:hypothetical protein [Stutzerimonas chloritidismutans]|uniref:hypothetical protein n=1 Tax=Stutzerimonas chloritidismutans TaxID=203192 RepID=UPI003F15AD20